MIGPTTRDDLFGVGADPIGQTIKINAQIFKKIKYFLFADDLFIIKASDFDEIGISAGDGAYVLGFPRGIRGEKRYGGGYEVTTGETAKEKMERVGERN